MYQDSSAIIRTAHKEQIKQLINTEHALFPSSTLNLTFTVMM